MKSRFISGALGAVMALSSLITPASALAQNASIADLQAQIQALLAQVASLQAQLGGQSPAPSPSVLKDGDQVRAVTDLRVRIAPSITASRLPAVSAGARGVIACQENGKTCPVSAQGYTWWYIKWTGTNITGWSVDGSSFGTAYLAKVEIPAANSPTKLSILNPLDGHLWTIGDNQAFQWSTYGIPSTANGYIDLVGNTGTFRVYSGPNTGSYTWNPVGKTISDAIVPAGTYSVKIIMNGIGDIRGPLTISSIQTAPATPPPSIQVLSPNGGETWSDGSQQVIRWSAVNLPSFANSNIRLSLIQIENGIDKPIIVLNPATPTNDLSFANDGSEEVTVLGVAPGTYKIRISASCPIHINDPICFSMYDDSDTPFTITAAKDTTPTLRVTSPNGDEVWLIGSTQRITWSSTNMWSGSPHALSTISLVSEKGISTPLLNAGTKLETTPTGGSYTWNVPAGIAPGLYRIEVTCTPLDYYRPCYTAGIGNSLNGTPHDQSDSLFAIKEAPAPEIAAFKLSYTGKSGDRVGMSSTLFSPDGQQDQTLTLTNLGTLTMSLSSLELTSSLGGQWDTIPLTGAWALGVASTIQTSGLINQGALNVAMFPGQSFKLFVSDTSSVQFKPGTVFTLKIGFHGGATRIVQVTIPPLTSLLPGTVWRLEIPDNWTVTWRRREGTDTFDALYKHLAYGTVTGVVLPIISGNTITVPMSVFSDGNSCNYVGTLSSDKQSIIGTYTCKAGGTRPWKVMIEGLTPAVSLAPAIPPQSGVAAVLESIRAALFDLMAKVQAMGAQ